MMRTKYLLIFALWFCMPLFSKGISKCDSLRVTGDVSHYVFKDTADNECTFAALKGKYVFLDIWSMSCGPCLREMAYLETCLLYTSVYANLNIIFLNRYFVDGA